MEVKFCRGCAEKDLEPERPLLDFGKRFGTTCGLQSRCKKCRSLEYRELHKNNPEYIARRKKWYKNNSKICIARAKEWGEANPEKVVDQQNRYQKKRYHEDLGYRIKKRLRNRMYCVLGDKKAGSAVKDLGCSLDEFLLYLEVKFTPKMSFNNHGSYWQLDHIKPLFSFDLTDREQFLAACHYTNLQPLTIAAHKKKTKLEASQRESLR